MTDKKLYVRADLEDYADVDEIKDDPDSPITPSRAERYSSRRSGWTKVKSTS